MNSMKGEHMKKLAILIATIAVMTTAAYAQGNVATTTKLAGCGWRWGGSSRRVTMGEALHAERADGQ